MFTLTENDGKIKWDAIQQEVEKAYDVKVAYSRLNKTEGHFAIDQRKLNDDLTKKVRDDSGNRRRIYVHKVINFREEYQLKMH